MQTWLVPFIYLAAILGMYLFAPGDRRIPIQQHLRKEPNFYMICDIILIAIAIPATLDYRQVWIDYVAWALMAMLIVVSLSRLWKAGAAKVQPKADLEL